VVFVSEVQREAWWHSRVAAPGKAIPSATQRQRDAARKPSRRQRGDAEQAKQGGDGLQQAWDATMSSW